MSNLISDYSANFSSLASVANSFEPLYQAAKESEQSESNLFKNIKVLSPLQIPSLKNPIPRPFWYYLTLGIPVLIEMFSVFCDGIVHRENTGEGLELRFRYKFLPKSQINQISRFHKYNELASSLLNGLEVDKAMEMSNQITLNIAKFESDSVSHQAELEKHRSIIALLEKNKNLSISRKNINEKDWKTLDLIDYEVAKDYFFNLVDIFNSIWFKNLNFSREIIKRFNVDYHEALIAEGLSMVVAYIEGLGGKTLSLPCVDKQTGIYRSVPYAIKEFFLGDALPCYIFESNDPQAAPWFIIRGTQLHKDRSASLESILADSIDYEGIASKIVNKSLVNRPIALENTDLTQKESLSDIFHHWHKENKHVILTGHSLGGTLANTIAIDFPDTLKTMYAFGAAGVAYKTGLKYQQLSDKLYNKMINFDFEGDLIPSGGHCLIGRHLSVKAVYKAERPIGFYESHVRNHLNRDFQVQLVDILKENNKAARFFCEKIRVIAGWCLRCLLSIFGRKYLPDWWKKRKIYKLQAKQQRIVIKQAIRN
jgi:hypothetical protein